ncbi:hypothetical protein ABZP36_034172 [Zizania latifolia]
MMNGTSDEVAVGNGAKLANISTPKDSSSASVRESSEDCFAWLVILFTSWLKGTRGVNDREILYTNHLQDVHAECIDAVAAVLNSHHFEKFQTSGIETIWDPYLCCRMINSENNLNAFDITELKGYSEQEVLGIISDTSSMAAHSDASSSSNNNNNPSSSDGARKTKRDADSDVTNNASDQQSTALEQIMQQYFSPGCLVECLSQDSGITGCWYRCSVIKRRNDRIRVRYLDINDPGQNPGNIEEWITVTGPVKPDELGIRLSGRLRVRPHNAVRSRSPSAIGLGAIVDAWLYDGWWEGIVVKIDDLGRLQVYFPEEKKIALFRWDHLRHSFEWIDDEWKPFEERRDIARRLPTGVELGADQALPYEFLKTPWLPRRVLKKEKVNSQIHGKSLHFLKQSLKVCGKAYLYDLTVQFPLPSPKSGQLHTFFQSSFELLFSAAAEKELPLLLHGLQALLHDSPDEHRLQRVLPQDQEGAAADARAGEPPDRQEARQGERLRRLQPAGRGDQDQEADQPPRRDTGGQGGRTAAAARRRRRRRR